MTREDARDRSVHYFASGDFEADLARLVAIPTESQVAEGYPHTCRYLEDEIIPMIDAMGFAARVFENPVEGVGPVLLATRDEGADLTVLGYGHGDVIRGQADQWTRGQGPWKLARDGERLYGRGTADNKAQHLINLSAMRAVLQTRGTLGFNAKFIIEMAEENGSQGLRELMDANRDAFAADVLIASDGPRVSPGRPTVSLGARGALNFDLICRLRDGGHHSGNWGGAIADPAMILSHALASICGPTGQILIKEWLPHPMSNAVREALADIELNPGEDGPAIDPGWGEPGMTTAERVYGWNSFAVLAMVSGNPEAPVNAIQPEARAHCQLRYIAGTDTDDILPALRRHLDAQGLQTVQVVPPAEGNAAGFDASRTEPDHPWALFVRSSISKTTGEAPAVIPQMGGSICNDLFTDLLGIPAIWVPHSYTGCSQHAPDEHVLLPVCENALDIMAGLYSDLGDASLRPAPE
ncbi:MAG: M20 family metallopeptidase [Pseudomonadota bacterium]